MVGLGPGLGGVRVRRGRMKVVRSGVRRGGIAVVLVSGRGGSFRGE